MYNQLQNRKELNELIQRLMPKHVQSVEEQENESEVSEIDIDTTSRKRPTSLGRVKDIKNNYVNIREQGQFNFRDPILTAVYRARQEINSRKPKDGVTHIYDGYDRLFFKGYVHKSNPIGECHFPNMTYLGVDFFLFVEFDLESKPVSINIMYMDGRLSKINVNEIFVSNLR